MTWEEAFRFWWSRLIPDSDWTVQYVADDTIESRAEVTHSHAYREATFRYNPARVPEHPTACHEVCHVLLGAIEVPVREATKALGGGGWHHLLESAQESAVDAAARAFMRAYASEMRETHDEHLG